MLSTKFKSLKKMAAFGAIAAACGFVKADTNEGYEDIQALPNGQVLVHNTDTNGVANIQGVKTPFQFVDADLNRGFAPAGLENASSVASDGTNCYANVDGKVVAFKLTKDGIPSVTDTILQDSVKVPKTYDMVPDLYNTTEETVNGKIIGASENGFVATYNRNNKGYIAYFEKEGDKYVDTYHERFWEGEPRLSYFDGETAYAMSDGEVYGINVKTGELAHNDDGDYTDITAFAVVKKANGRRVNIFGYSDGSINNYDNFLTGAISNISVSPDKTLAYATTGTTNEYAIINAQTGSVSSKGTVPGVDKVKKVIDNPKKPNKILYITQQKMGALTK